MMPHPREIVKSKSPAARPEPLTPLLSTSVRPTVAREGSPLCTIGSKKQPKRQFPRGRSDTGMKPDRDGLAVLWDMDGTLVDTAELHFAAWLRLMQELGRPFSRADFAATFGMRNPEIFAQ